MFADVDLEANNIADKGQRCNTHIQCSEELGDAGSMTVHNGKL